MEYIKVYYTKIIAELNFEQFEIFVLGIQKQRNKYRDYTADNITCF